MLTGAMKQALTSDRQLPLRVKRRRGSRTAEAWCFDSFTSWVGAAHQVCDSDETESVKVQSVYDHWDGVERWLPVLIPDVQEHDRSRTHVGRNVFGDSGGIGGNVRIGIRLDVP